MRPSIATRAVRGALLTAALTLIAVLGAAPAASAVDVLFLLTDDDRIVRVRSATPGLVDASGPVTGLPAGARLLGADFRPSTGQLIGAYALDDRVALFAIEPQSGAATRVGTGSADLGDPAATAVVSIDPDADRLRVVTSANRNLVMDLDTGDLVAEQTPIAYATGDDGVPTVPALSAMHYNRSTAGLRLLAVDAARHALTRIGATGGPPLPDTGAMRTMAPLGFDVGERGAMDQALGDGAGYAVLSFAGESQSSLYRLNGSALTMVGPVNVGPISEPTSVLAVAAGLGGVVDFRQATYTAGEATGGVTLKLKRAGTVHRPTRVTLAVSGGSAVPGEDFALPEPYVDFAAGQRDAELFIPIADDGVGEPTESLSVDVTDPTGSAGLGPARRATITIFDPWQPPPGQASVPVAPPPSVGAAVTSVPTVPKLKARLRPLRIKRMQKTLRVPFSCSRACKVAVEASIDTKTARRLKRARYLGRATAVRLNAGSGVATIRVRSPRRLDRLRGARVRVTLTPWEQNGTRRARVYKSLTIGR